MSKNLCLKDLAILLFILVATLDGVQANPTTDNCYEKTLESRVGRITSPKYPHPYKKRLCIRWTLTKSWDAIFTISFDDLSIEAGDNCSRGYIDVQTGQTTRRFCNNNPRRVITTAASQVVVTFVTLGYYFSHGFSALYIISTPYETCNDNEFRCSNPYCVLRAWRCNGVAECRSGRDELNCLGLNKSARLDKHGSTRCGKNTFSCRDPTTRRLKCLSSTRLCDGITDCDTAYSNDESIANCKHRPGCVKTLTSPSGVITTPNYPHNYSRFAVCDWAIDLSHPGSVEFTFNTFRLSQSASVIVYDGYFQSGYPRSVLAVFTYNRPPAVVSRHHGRLVYRSVVSRGQYMRVVFRAGALGGVGFKATFRPEARCHGEGVPCSARRRDEGCYKLSDRCNGLPQCKNGADELGCTSDQCGSANGTFLCADGQCIYETWVCDNAHDCRDSSDERHCPVAPRKVIIAAIIGSTLCSLLLVVALGCTCKLVSLLYDNGSELSGDSVISRMRAEISRRQAPPTYDDATSNDDSRSPDSRRQRRQHRRQRSNRSRGQNLVEAFDNPAFEDSQLCNHSDATRSGAADENGSAEACRIHSFPATGIAVQFHKSSLDSTGARKSSTSELTDSSSICSYDRYPDSASINSGELPPPYTEAVEQEAVNHPLGAQQTRSETEIDLRRNLLDTNENEFNEFEPILLPYGPIELREMSSQPCNSLINFIDAVDATNENRAISTINNHSTPIDIAPNIVSANHIPIDHAPPYTAVMRSVADQPYYDTDDSDLIDIS